MQHAELVVIGAGPAGMAAAATAAEAGVNVVLFDEQAHAGGQIYRDVERVAGIRGNLLGKDYTEGKHLALGLRHERIRHLDSAVVWSIEDDNRVSYSRRGCAGQMSASKLILATGALERAMPLPGWTLPGVMTVGAGQILLKQSGLLPTDSVLVGCGPLLYLVASQMVKAGKPPKALVETTSPGDVTTAVRQQAASAWQGGAYLFKGVCLLASIIRARVPRFTGARDITIEGQDGVEAIAFHCRGQNHRIPCRIALLHHGVVTNTQVARSMNLAHRWNPRQHCFHADVDEWGSTSREHVFIAGDSARIGGAKVAELDGRLTALQVAKQLGRLSSAAMNSQATPLFAAREKEMAVRPFLDVAYPPCAEALLPSDDTIVCRCEEVTAGSIRRYAELGCLGPNQAKAFGRVGMGPCQGRYCGLSVTALLSEANQKTPDETGYYRIRPPLKPVTLGELASMDTEEPCA